MLKQKPDKLTLFIIKLISVLFVFWGILYFIVLVYMGLYQVVNILDTKAYFRYASDGKFTTDIYFKEAEEKGTRIFDTVNELYSDNITPSRIQELFKKLIEDEKKLKEKINNNDEYINYLGENGLNLDDLISYMKRIISLDEIILYAGMYVGLLAFILILYFFYKWRIGIFIFSGILYFVLVIDSFMSGILLNALFPWFKQLGITTYEEYLIISKGMLPATREATLTFIILDTVVQSKRDSKKRKRSSRLINTYLALNDTLNFLRQVEKKYPNMIITRLKTIDFEVIYSFSRENKEDLHLREAKEILDEYNLLIKTKKISVTELNNILLNIQQSLIKSEFIKNNIIR